jgi:hypothetical protein
MECAAMVIRGVPFAALAVLMLATGALAEPPKPAGRETHRPAKLPSALAPAAEAKTAAALAANVQSPQRPVRVARATTCRCGDPAVPVDEGEQ